MNSVHHPFGRANLSAVTPAAVQKVDEILNHRKGSSEKDKRRSS